MKVNAQNTRQQANAAKLRGRNIKVIGLGGIGSPVAQGLAQFLASTKAESALWLIDGDDFEERNRERVLFQSYDNKALTKAKELTAALDARVQVIPVPRYVTPWNARHVIEEGDIVFMCVDNHATRKVVNNRCRRLQEVVLFSGGNDGIEDGKEGTFGNVQTYIRGEGRDLTNPLTRWHPEIAKPADRRPDQQGCVEMSDAAPQLFFTNLAVASTMLAAFYAWLRSHAVFEEVYLDIALARMQPVRQRRLAEAIKNGRQDKV